MEHLTDLWLVLSLVHPVEVDFEQHVPTSESLSKETKLDVFFFQTKRMVVFSTASPQ